MKKYTSIHRRQKMELSAALALLMICGLMVAFAPRATAAVGLLYFKATAGSDTILVEWETATEQNTSAFNLYRSEDSGSRGQQIGGMFPARGDGITGAKYSYPDTGVTKGVRYYYSLEEIPSSGGGPTIVATANTGIDLPTLTPTATATATVTSTATATSSATATRARTATNVPEGTSDGQATATRQFTLTPPPIATTAAGSTPTPALLAPGTPTPIGVGVVSTPTGGPPTVAPLNAVATTVPTPLPPPTPTVLAASPSPEITGMSEVQPADQVTPTATPPPQVFAAATARPVLGTPAQTTPAPAGETPRNTGSIFLLGGGAILLAAVIGGGALLYLRSRHQ
jgi:hypothetical protein